MDKKESEKNLEKEVQKEESVKSVENNISKEPTPTESAGNIKTIKDAEDVEDAENVKNVEKQEKENENAESSVQEEPTSENVQPTDASTAETAPKQSEDKDNTKVPQKKTSKTKIVVVIILATILGVLAFFGLGDKKEELSKTKYDHNYNYSMTQEVQEFNIKVTGKYKKDEALYYQCDVTPKGDEDNKFKIETAKKPADKKIVGAKYIYTVSYPKHEEKQYFYYETEYGNSVSDKKIQQFNSTKYIDKYYDEHFVEPSKK